MASINYSTAQSRSEQMKRELIGLVIGTSLLMAGMAFLFSQTIIADSPVSTAAADKSETVAPVAAAPATTPVSAPATTAAPLDAASPAAVTLASSDVVTNATANTAVAPVSTTETPATPAPAPIDSTQPVQTDVAATATPATAATVPATDATATPATPVTEEQPGRTGWIYAGQFANGKWSEQGLKVGSELPASGSRYALTWGATVRDMPPGKRSSASGKLGKTVGNLAAGQEVEIVQVKKSGRQGHVWVEVKL